MSRFFLNAANAVINFIVVAALCVSGLYAGYALWDNNRIYTSAQNVQDDMIKLKPVIEEDGGASFEELLAINPDVCAWVTLDNTNIDYPVLQGEDNLSYINTDVYGEFALAGSIFLDTRNDRNFTDTYSVLYGHHMANSKMFGDLDKYKDETFFEENKTGMLILPDRAYELEIFALLLVSSSDENIYEPTQWQDNIDGLLVYAEDNAVFIHEDVLEALKAEGSPQVLALTTCGSEFTDARTIILAAMEPYTAVAEEEE